MTTLDDLLRNADAIWQAFIGGDGQHEAAMDHARRASLADTSWMHANGKAVRCSCGARLRRPDPQRLGFVCEGCGRRTE